MSSVDEAEDGFASREEFEENVRRLYPDSAHTLNEPEHDYNNEGPCWCDECIEAGQ